MDSPGVKDTTAYKIVRQIMDHIWGSEEKLSSEDFLRIYHDFMGRGASWEALMDDSMDSIEIIEDCIGKFVEARANKCPSK